MREASDFRPRGGAAVSIFGLIFLLVGLGVGLFFAKSAFEVYAARDWAPVDARLLGVDLQSNRDSDGDTTWRVTAEYEYLWRGERLFSDRVDLHPGADNLGDYHQVMHERLQRALRAGEPVTAWVDPDDPSRAVLNREMRWGLLGFGMIFPLVFGGAGLGVMFLGRRAGRETKKRDARKELYPDQPWMWVDKWRTPTIAGETRTAMWLAIGFAAIWNLVSLPVLFIVPGEVADGNHAVLVGLLFPLIGVGLAVWAVREVIRHRRYGASKLELQSHPVPLAGHMRATLNVPARLQAREVQVQLACINRYATGSGKNRSTRENVLWEDKQRAPATSGAGPGQTSARIEMRLPAGQPVSSDENPKNRIIWRLTATSEEPGVDYKAVFELPVFDTGEAVAEAVEGDAPAAVFEADDWHETGVVHDYASGGQRFVFPRYRLLGAGLGLMFGGLVFTGAGVGMVLLGGMWVFGGIFAAVGLLLLWGAISMLFQRSEVIVGNGRLRWCHGVFGGWQEVEAGALKSISVEKSGSVGSNLYFQLKIERWGREGKTAIAGWIPGERPARALAAHWDSLLGGERTVA